MASDTAVREPSASAGSERAATFGNVLRSEWTKLWSVRSTLWTLIILCVLMVGFGALISLGQSSNMDQLPADQRATFDATSVSLSGIFFGQLALAVLGALVITTEYSTGGIRTSLTAVPKRLRLLLAKALALAVVAWVVGTIVSFVAFLVSQPIFNRVGLGTTLSSPGVLRAVFGGGLYLLGSALFGFALGALLRHTAAAITLVVGLLMVVPPFLQLLPGDWGQTIFRNFTSTAGFQITRATPNPELLGPWTGYAVFSAYWVITLAVAAVLLQRRDA